LKWPHCPALTDFESNHDLFSAIFNRHV
jgi:hypothetical protein